MAENLSGVPPAVSLSGLDAGAGGFSGATQQALGGTGGYGQTPFGMEGGMDLNSLMQLLAGGETAGVGTGGDIGQSLAQGSIGQQQGGLGAGSFGQTQPQPGQQYMAGQSSAGVPGSMGAGSADPLAIIQKSLGLAQKGAGILGGAMTASPVLGMQSDMTGSDPQAFAAQRAGERQDFTASPFNMAGQSPFMTGETGLGPDANQIAGEMSGGYEGGYGGAPGSGFGSFPGETMGEMGGSSAGGMTLGTGDSAGGTNWMGAAGGTLGAGSGLMGILQGMQGGNAGQAAGGSIQSLSGIAQALKSSPELAQSLGITPDMLGGSAAGLQALGAALGLYQGVESGNAGQIGQGAIGAVGAADSATQAINGSGALGAAGAYVPLIGAVLQGLTSDMSYQAADATAKQAMISSAVATASAVLMSNPIGAAFMPVLFAAMAVNQALNPKTNADINKVAGQVGPGATEALGEGANLFSGIDYKTAGNDQLMQAIVGGTQSLMPQYDPMGSGMGTSGSQTGVSRYVEGLKAADPQSYEAYQRNQQGIYSGLASSIQELMGRGMTYQQLGQLPVSGDWAQQELVAGNTPQEMFERNYATNAPGQTQSRWAEGQGLASQLLRPGYTPGDQFGGASEMLNEALGAAMLGREQDTHASGNMTGMYGGPLWAALARSGAGGNQGLMSLINQNFDPWFSARTWDPATRQQHYQTEQAAQQAMAPSASWFSNA